MVGVPGFAMLAAKSPRTQPRIEAVATVDLKGHLLVFGGTDPATGIPSRSVWSYDISADDWSQRNDLAPGIPTLPGWSAVTGADGQIYLMGGEPPGIPGAASAFCHVYDSNSDQWLASPVLKSASFQVVVLPPTTDVVPPTPVGVFAADSVAADRCVLRWTPSGDNIGIGSYSLRAVHFGAVGQSNHVVTLSVAGSETNAVMTG